RKTWMAGLVTASLVYQTCGQFNAEVGQARLPMPSTSSPLESVKTWMPGIKPGMTMNTTYGIKISWSKQ
ncbi:MAG: hypothetical protein WB037_16595, partial [Pseudolabrys sp.]